MQELHSNAQDRSSTSLYRSDIDGLRFFAIVPVVLYHAVSTYVPSGFVGVDIFFVISGYLIGGILYRESGAGTFSFANFYARRVRRILPALLVVVAFTVAVGLLLLTTDEMTLLAGSAQWTVLGVSNVFFYRYIDYFSPDASTNPLLMTWSLGIEEQFYFVFPFVLLALRRLRRRYVLLALMMLNAISLAIAIWLASTNPLAGFYLLPARAWELGAGAALAIVHAQVPRERRTGSASDVLAAGGLAMIVAASWLFSEATPFPGYAALVPVVGTVLLLHTGDSRINRRVLSAKPLIAVGLVSYSWYLWHWPLMAFVRASAYGEPAPSAMLAVAVLSLGIAALSWRFVEQPLRRGTLPPAPLLARYAAFVGALLAALAWLKHERAFEDRRLPAHALRIEETKALSLAGPGCMTQFGDTKLPREPACAPPGATVALIGDSHATAARFGLKDHVEARQSRLLQLTKASCPPLLGFSRKDDLAPNGLVECPVFLAHALKRVVRDPQIRTVVLTSYLDSREATASYRVAGENFVLVPAETALTQGYRAIATALRRADKQVVIVLDVPKFSQDIHRNHIIDAIPLRREIARLTSADPSPDDDLAATRPMRLVLRQALRDMPGVTVIDLADQFCTAGRCTTSERGMPLYIDPHHLSILGSRRVIWDAVPVSPAQPAP